MLCRQPDTDPEDPDPETPEDPEDLEDPDPETPEDLEDPETPEDPEDPEAHRTTQAAQAAVVVADFPMPPGTRFDWHTHVDQQLAWAASGVLTVITEDATWVLPPTRALWIPAGLPHETGAEGRATMRTLYIRPDLSPVSWPEPTPIAASRLLAEPQRVRRRLPPRDRPDPGGLLPPRDRPDPGGLLPQ